MLRRDLLLVLSLVGIAIIISTIFIWTTLSLIDAAPLTYDAMMEKANTLPEVKAFLKLYPNAAIRANDMGIQDLSGHWIPANNGSALVNYRVGGQRGFNLMELEVHMNRTSGEILQSKIDCWASTYVQGIHEPDPETEFHHTSKDTDIAQFIEKEENGLCKYPPGYKDFTMTQSSKNP